MAQVRVGWRAYVGSATASSDSDATAFVSAAGITNGTQISAINTLVTDLKAYGLWSKMRAIYPMVGGTAYSHKFNLKDPRDLDAAYRLIFSGGWTHTSSGAKPNGTTAWADTKLSPSAVYSNVSDISIGFYSRTNVAEESTDIGSVHGNNAQVISIQTRWTDNLIYTQIYRDGFGYSITAAHADSTGLFVSTRTSSSLMRVYRNFSLLGENTSGSIGTIPTSTIMLSNNLQFSTREQAFSFIGNGLSEADVKNLYISVQKFQTTLGRQIGTPYASDADAVAFLNAAGIYDGAQASAINSLVIGMKAAGIWTKMKALYPFVGGSANAHKFNLKDPRDLDAAYRLQFNGGWTHTLNGAKPNGSNTYANTYIVPNDAFNTTDLAAAGYYSRTAGATVPRDYVLGCYTAGRGSFAMVIKRSSDNFYTQAAIDFPSGTSYRQFELSPNPYGGDGLYHFSQQGSSFKFWRNTTLIGQNGVVAANLPQATHPIYLGALNGNGTAVDWTDKELALAYFSSKLSDAEASSMYSLAQAYQTSLGRQVSVPVLSDADAQSFLNAAGITSYQQAAAVNKLVVDLKAAGVWTKMKAIYPFVGGNANSHKFNLKDPRDLDAAFRLVFNGGWVHSSTGAQPNGTTGYADTKLNENSVMTLGSQHISFYSRTNVQGLYLDMGIWGNTSAPGYPAGYGSQLLLRYTWPSTTDSFIGYSTDGDNNYISNNDSRGFFMSNRTSNSQLKLQKNSTINTFTSNAINKTNLNFYIGARNIYNSTSYLYSPRETAFATIGDGLTDTEATALYTAVQTYQTSLGRQVNTEINTNSLVLSLDAGNANSYPGSGTSWYDMASGYSATLVNGAAYDSSYGGSIYVDGSNDYVGLPSGLLTTGDFTVLMYVQDLNSPNGGGTIFGNYPAGNLQLFYGSNACALWLNNPTCYSSNPNIIYSRLPQMIATKRQGSSTYIYANAALMKQGSSSDAIGSSNAAFRIGTNTITGEQFKGRIFRVDVYKRALSDAEILEYFNSTRGRFGI